MKIAVLMDIAAAQRAVNRFGRVDRILIKLPANGNVEEWQTRLQERSAAWCRSASARNWYRGKPQDAGRVSGGICDC